MHHAGGGSHGSLDAGRLRSADARHRHRAARADGRRQGRAARERALARAVIDARRRMVEQQLVGRDIRDERVLEAMERVPRELFVPEELRGRAYDDAALPIGSGQTISQPAMVALICELLALARRRARPRRRHRLGLPGGGARRARAPRCTRSSGSPELAERARANARGRRLRGPRRRARRRRDARRSRARALRARSPSPPRRPNCRPTLYEQLEPDGRLVLPVGSRHDQLLELVVREADGPRVDALRARAASSRSSAARDSPDR